MTLFSWCYHIFCCSGEWCGPWVSCLIFPYIFFVHWCVAVSKSTSNQSTESTESHLFLCRFISEPSALLRFFLCIIYNPFYIIFSFFTSFHKNHQYSSVYIMHEVYLQNYTATKMFCCLSLIMCISLTVILVFLQWHIRTVEKWQQTLDSVSTVILMEAKLSSTKPPSLQLTVCQVFKSMNALEIH